MSDFLDALAAGTSTLTTAHLRLSPSRVELYLTCPARWCFSELEGFKEEETPQQAFGTAVHLQHEYYFGPKALPYQTQTPHGLLAWEMASKYPDRADFVRWRGAVEHELLHTVDGVTLEGRADMLWFPPAEGVAVVGDHKTTGSLRYAKLERADLFGHAQAPFYLFVAMDHFGVDRARSHWVYATTTGTPARLELSRHLITKEEARDRVYTRMLPVVKEMVAAQAAGMTGIRMPKNLTACYKYNRRCPHYARCQPERHKVEMSAFLEAIGKESEPTPAPAAPVVVAAPAVVATLVVNNPADPTAGAPVNPPEGDGKGKGKGKRAAGEKGGPTLDEATLDALADRVVDKLALRLMGGVK